MDRLQIQGIRAYGYSGVLPEEQVLGQWFEVDLELWLDLEQAGVSDCLSDACDYRALIEGVQRLIREQPYALIERLAREVAIAVLQTDPQLQQIEVRLTKVPPIPDFSGCVTVCLRRSRADLL